MKGLLGTALGTGLYVYSSADGSAFAVRMAAYLAAVAIVAWSLIALARGALRALRSYRRTVMYSLRSRQIIQRDGLRVSAGEPTRVTATVIVLEPAVARMLALDAA